MIGRDFGGAPEHLGVQVFQLADSRLEVLEPLGALLVATDLGIDFLHQLVELAYLRRRTLDDFALRLEGRDLLRDAIGQGLQRRQLALGLHRLGGSRG